MFVGVFRTKEGKIITAILAFLMIVIGFIIFVNTSESKKYREQAVMAEQLLKEGNYEQAVDAYIKAMSMKDSDQELLSIGLANSYVGINDYDKALEVLRSCYQKTSGVKIKEKIEEVTSAKTDYEYLQSISRADIYFANKEYDKAIAEYEKAKSIKSKEIESYQGIAEAYLKKEDYKKAQEEVKEGLALTKSKELNKTLEKVNSYLLKAEYDSMVEEASEYIAQENYKDGITKYLEAITLMPTGEEAYSNLAEEYISEENYKKAIQILTDARKFITSDQLKDLLDQATALQEEVDKRNQILSKLYVALNQLDIKKIQEIINDNFFIENIITDKPVYYSSQGEGDISKGYGMIIYDVDTIYSGDIKDGMKKGTGVYYKVTKTNGKKGFYYYDGEWSNDIPNGNGKTEEETWIVDKEGNEYRSNVVTDGTFYNGLENGPMHKYFYRDGKETGNVTYAAINGVPVPMVDDKGQVIPVTEGESYAIGVIYLEDQPTKENYIVKSGTVWGIKPFYKNDLVR